MGRTWLIQQRGSLSQTDVAAACGITQQHYCNIELGIRCPSVPLAKRIAEELGFEWELFYQDDAELPTGEQALRKGLKNNEP